MKDISRQGIKINDIDRSQPVHVPGMGDLAGTAQRGDWFVAFVSHTQRTGFAGASIHVGRRNSGSDGPQFQIGAGSTCIRARAADGECDIADTDKRAPRTARAERPTERSSDPLQPHQERVPTPPIPPQAIEPRIVEMAKSKTWPLEEPKEPATVVPSTELVGSQSVQHEQETDTAESASSENDDAVPMPETNTTGPTSNTSADHQWLVELLWRRVAELKSYPNAARMNGQEGKVLVKAVIRSDGYLAAVSVLKSSGHELLDEAAIETVKLACPLRMKHTIGKPQIVVSLPIAYSIAR